MDKNFVLSNKLLKIILNLIISVPGVMWLVSFIFGLYLCISALCSLCRQLQQYSSSALLIVLRSRFCTILKELFALKKYIIQLHCMIRCFKEKTVIRIKLQQVALEGGLTRARSQMRVSSKHK